MIQQMNAHLQSFIVRNYATPAIHKVPSSPHITNIARIKAVITQNYRHATYTSRQTQLLMRQVAQREFEFSRVQLLRGFDFFKARTRDPAFQGRKPLPSAGRASG